LLRKHMLLLLLLPVVNKLAQQCCCLQRMIRPCALTQCEAAADGKPVACPNASCQVIYEAAAVN
jgi:hypothetical protein